MVIPMDGSMYFSYYPGVKRGTGRRQKDKHGRKKSTGSPPAPDNDEGIQEIRAVKGGQPQKLVQQTLDGNEGKHLMSCVWVCCCN